MNKPESRNGIEVFSVKHLPIVRAYADKLGVVEVLNQRVPSGMEVEPGIFFLGMLLDTLSGRSPLYRLEEFFETQDIELLFGKPIKAKSFNDDNVGRFLDQLYETGTRKIFTAIAQRAIERFEIRCRHVHFDTTSRSVFGVYMNSSEQPEQSEQGEPRQKDPQCVSITYGHSKDHRSDLKQFVMSLLCVERNVPIFTESSNGNASDKTLNNEILTDISSYMAQFGIKDDAFVYIADSAVVTEANLKTLGKRLFITRLPATYTECGRVLEEAVKAESWVDLGMLAETKPTQNRPGTCYRAYETEVTLYEEVYRAIVIHSSAHDKRRQKRLDRDLQAERQRVERIVRDAGRVTYFCQPDAQAAAERLMSTLMTYSTLNVEVEERPKYTRGRPKGGVKEIARMEYGVMATIQEHAVAIERRREEAGCFVLLTNVPRAIAEATGTPETTEATEITETGSSQATSQEVAYDAKEVLQAYKEQHGIEHDFGFLKDPMIVNSLFLDKPERIEALGLILVTSLLLWRLMERTMRQSVKDHATPLSGWDHKPTRHPTSFMMTTKFSGVMTIKIGTTRRLNRGFTTEQQQFLDALQVSPEVFTQPRQPRTG